VRRCPGITLCALSGSAKWTGKRRLTPGWASKQSGRKWSLPAGSILMLMEHRVCLATHQKQIDEARSLLNSITR